MKLEILSPKFVLGVAYIAIILSGLYFLFSKIDIKDLTNTVMLSSEIYLSIVAFIVILIFAFIIKSFYFKNKLWNEKILIK